jgi:cytochrome b
MHYRIKVWDLSIRLFHWVLVGAIAFLWWSGTQGKLMDYHPLAGYCVMGLVVYRIIWGFIGTRYARFRDFVRGPLETVRALTDMFGPHSRQYLSHNPIGGWMVLVLLSALLFQGLTGLGTSDDLSIDGPLVAVLSGKWVGRLTGWHHFNANILLTLIGLHILAVLFHDVYRREGLVRSMLSGYKHSSAFVPAAELPVRRFLLIVAGIAGIIYYYFLI